MQNVIETKVLPTNINWKNFTIVASFHLLVIPALFMFSWQNVAAMLIGNWIVGSLGVGLGYHRLLTHRSFKAPKWLEYFLTALGTMSVQDDAIRWVATHRIHHAFTETEKDPHSTKPGFWWAQIGWVLFGTAQDHDREVLKKFVPDLMKDKFQVLLSKYFFIPIIVSAFILFAIGGWSMVFWGVFVRVVVGWHTTWFVNSLSHIYGDKPYETMDDSTNNWFVAILTFGEGWHNNHHAFPTSARHGLQWYQFDMNWITIRIFEKLGWAKNIRLFDIDKPQYEMKKAA
ncbi:MAG: fatty acid desaturase [Pyrinomonadaceae bacterium]